MVFVKGHRHSIETRKKMSESRMGKEPWNKNLKGFLAGRVSPMKGRLQSEASKRKISDALKGRDFPQFANQVGKNHPYYGKHRSEETKQKIREKLIGRKLPVETRLKMSRSRRGMSTWNKGKPNPKIAGKNHWKWKDGSSLEPYGLGWTNSFKDNVRELNGNICVLSLSKGNGRKLHIHHVNGDKKDHRPENLMLLQGWIHQVIHGDEEFWEGTPYLKTGR